MCFEETYLLSVRMLHDAYSTMANVIAFAQQMMVQAKEDEDEIEAFLMDCIIIRNFIFPVLLV